MRHCKDGQWWELNSQRSLANNSAVYMERPDTSTFLKEWRALYDSKSGERGIFNRSASIEQAKKTGRREYEGYEFGTNPCSEIILRDREFCNLTEVVIRENDTIETMKEKVEVATILGTIQATLTDFKYITKEWKKNCEEERLLGVSLTGIMDHKHFSGSGDLDKLKYDLQVLKNHSITTNAKYAKKLNINPSASITCIKPSGCQTLDGKIKTTEGIMTVEEIFNKNGIYIEDMEAGQWYEMKEKMFVYDMNNDEKEITKLYCNGLAEVYEIEAEDGQKYKFTGNHQLLTNNGWVRVDKLKEDDEIISF